jgi:hypothetical protein
MFSVKGIDTYRDGGTIAIKCVMSVRWKEVKWLEDRQGEVIEVCIDDRFGKEPKFWFGYPGKEDSEIIEDETIIDYVIGKIEEHKKYQDYKLNKIINFKQELRDWKINNILNE